MKRYIVTEAELEELKLQVRLVGDDLEPDLKDLWKAEDACLSRPVPEWATEFAGDPHNVGYVESWEFEEIPK